MSVLSGALPDVALEGGIWLAILRAGFDAAAFSAFGTLLFRGLTVAPLLCRLPTDAAAVLDRRMLGLARASLLVAALALLGWLVAQAGAMADTPGLGRCLAAVPLVLRATRFGHLVLLQLALLGLALRGRGRITTVLAGGVLLLQAAHGHQMTTEGALSLLALSGIVHLLAGGAWLGGLLPLLLAVRLMPPRVAAGAARSFSVLGKWCVGLMILTAAIQSWSLVGSVPALFGTAYGWMACIKLLVLVLLLGFACLNRYRLAPGLLGADPPGARRMLTTSLVAQTGAGLLVLLAAAILSGLPPGIHVQPVWPFAWQISLETLREDPDDWPEVLAAAAALAGAVLLAVVGVILHRWRRIAALSSAVLIAVLALPHLDLLLIEANPASFDRSPTGFSAASIVEGATLYPVHCAGCHGLNRRGDGPLAAHLPVSPADLTAGHLWMHTDGELFWWLAHGIAAPDGGPAMPGFGATLSEDERWTLIDFIRAANAGDARRRAGRWASPLRAPVFGAECANGQAVTLADLQGRMIGLVAGMEAPVAADGMVTMQLATGPVPQPGRSTCIAADRSILRAYAIASGLDEVQAAASWFLIDADGWLRDVVPRPAGPAGLGAAIAALRRPLGHAAGADAMPMQMSMP